MTRDAKRNTLAWLAGLMILTALIAVALPQLELKPGARLSGQAESTGGVLPDLGPAGLAISMSDLWKAILGILVAVGAVYNSYQLLKGVAWNWKNVVGSLFYIATLIFVFLGIVLILSNVHLTVKPPQVWIPPPVFDIKGPPLGPLLWLVGLGLAAALVGLGVWLVFLRPAPDLLQLEAERALQALKMGLDFMNVIQNCYWQMAQVLKQERGLEREAAMTAREFERLLEARGVPPAPVHQLTQLFEAARYGHRPPSSDDERQAVDCLTAIVRYSQAGKRRR